jgi:hypothetical protein
VLRTADCVQCTSVSTLAKRWPQQQHVAQHSVMGEKRGIDKQQRWVSAFVQQRTTGFEILSSNHQRPFEEAPVCPAMDNVVEVGICPLLSMRGLYVCICVLCVSKGLESCVLGAPASVLDL